MAKKTAQVRNLQFDILAIYILKILCISTVCLSLFLGYRCSKENICNGKGECMDGGWCMCKPGWSSKEDCSGIFILRKIFES